MKTNENKQQSSTTLPKACLLFYYLVASVAYLWLNKPDKFSERDINQLRWR